MGTRSFAAGLVVVMVTTMASAALAQSATDPRAVGPYRGLFGGNQPAPDSPQVLDFTGSLFGGYDDDVTGSSGTGGGGAGASIDPRAQASSFYTGGGARLRYARDAGDRFDFDTEGDVSSSYYPDLEDLVAIRYGARVGLDWTVSPRARLITGYRFRYQPFFGYSVFSSPDLPEVIDTPELGTDTRVVRRENYEQSAAVSFTRDLSVRSSLSADAMLQRTDFVDNSLGYQDQQYWGAGGRWRYRLTQNTSARVGYGYRSRDSGLEDQRTLEMHNIDVGVDYGRALSFSRRTQFSFGTGTAGYVVARDEGTSQQDQFRFTFVGNVRLSHEIGQSWTAALTYDRNVRLVNGFGAPFLTDTIGAYLTGYSGPRTRLSLLAGYWWGDYGGRESSKRSTRTGYVTPSVQFALTRQVALQATYFYYRYLFSAGLTPLPPGFPPEYSRQGFRVSVSFWAPLIGGGGAP